MTDRELAADIASLLLERRPERDSAEDVARLLVLALEHYSREVKGTGDSYFMECLVKLRRETGMQVLSLSGK